MGTAIPLVQPNRNAGIRFFVRNLDNHVTEVDAVRRSRKRSNGRNSIIALAVAQREASLAILDHASSKVHRQNAHGIGLRRFCLPHAHPIRFKISRLVRSDFNVVTRPAANGQVHDDVLRRKLLDFGRAIVACKLLVVKIKTEGRFVPFHCVRMETSRAIRVVVLVSAKRSFVVPRRAMAVVPARVSVMQVVMVLLTRCGNFKNIDFRRPAVLQRPERRPCTLLPRSLEAAFDIAILHFEVSLGVNRTRGVIDRNFLVIELCLRPVSGGFRMLFLFTLELESSIRNYDVFLGAIGAVVVRGAPIVGRVPLFLVE